MRRKITLIILLFFASYSALFAQNVKVSGKVTDESGLPLPGVSVKVKGTTNGVMTNVDGLYSLSVPSPAILNFSFIGYVSRDIAISNSSTINVVLAESSTNLNEVVVVGYGTQRLTTVSGAISTVKSADIERLHPVRVEDALQGQASGVLIVQSGSPGSKPTVFVRGIPSYVGNDPLIIVDGVTQTLDDFNSINPSDIESVSVLKDAATTAIYGVKGGNGVVVVTTKGGQKNQKTEFSVTSNFGIQQVLKPIGVLNATEYAAIVNEGSVSSGGNIIFPNLSILGTGTDWQKQVFHNAPTQQYNISARGGSDRVTYFLGAGYTGQGGIVGGIDKSKFERSNFTANLNFDLTPKLKFILNTTGDILRGKGVQENSFNSILGSALNFDPTVPVLNTVPGTVGQYGFSNLILSEVYNPLTKLDNTYNQNNGSKLYGKFELQYQIIKGLKATSRFGYTKYDADAKSFNPLVFYGPLNVDNSLNADGSTVVGKHNSVAQSKTSNFNYSWENFASYSVNIKQDHHFDAVVGFAMQKSTGNSAGANRQDVPFNSYQFADFTAATGTNTSTNPTASGGYYYEYFSKNISYFGRLNYDYDEKYLASFSIRDDGSLNFGAANKFANFYAGSLGWVISKESFFKPGFINYLKIRGSLGTSGVDNATPQYYQISTGGPDYGPTANSNGYTFGNAFYPGATLNTLANPGLKWQTDKQLSVGFDLVFYKNKLSLTADYFQKNVSGLLFKPFNSVSLYVGNIPPPFQNIGSTKTNGVEITLGYNEKIGKSFSISNKFNFTASKNQVTSTDGTGPTAAFLTGGGFFNGQPQTVTRFQTGSTPGYFYGYKTNGLFQSAAEIAAAPTQPGAQPGDIRFVDTNGDGKIDANDQVQIGDPFPSFTLGWNLNLNFKGIDFSAFTYASVGNNIYRAYERNGNFTNKFRGVLARWTGPGTTNDARDPRYSFNDPNSNIRVSDRYIEDGSFVKIKNIQLGYTIPASLTKNIFKSIRIYGEVRNAYTFTKYSGYDPEISGGVFDSGIDRGAYPQARVYAFGLDFRL